MPYRCTEECRDEHCVHPIACELRGQCPPQNPDLQPGDGLDTAEFVVKQPGPKCCPLHRATSNRAQRREADRLCVCRGECGHHPSKPG